MCLTCSRYGEYPADMGEGKMRRSWRLENLPSSIGPTELKALIFLRSVSSLLSFSASASVWSDEVPLPAIDRHSFFLAFVVCRCWSSSSPFLPICLSDSHSLSLALPCLCSELELQIANFFLFLFSCSLAQWPGLQPYCPWALNNVIYCLFRGCWEICWFVEVFASWDFVWVVSYLGFYTMYFCFLFYAICFCFCLIVCICS